MFVDFGNWWDALEGLSKIYWGIAIPFTIFFLLQLLLTFIGGDVMDDADSDMDSDVDHGIGFQFFTLKNLVAFFTIFAWAGIACLDAGLSNITSIIVSFFSGLTMMLVMGGLFYFLSRATESGTLKMENAIGTVGEVYMEIKAARGNIGKVQVQVQGTLRTLEAMTDDDEDLKTSQVVEVTKIANSNILIVTKSKS